MIIYRLYLHQILYLHVFVVFQSITVQFTCSNQKNQYIIAKSISQYRLLITSYITNTYQSIAKVISFTKMYGFMGPAFIIK